MSEDNMKMAVRVDTTADTSGIDKAIQKAGDLQSILAKFNGSGLRNYAKSFDDIASKIRSVAGVSDLEKGQVSAMRALRQRWSFEERMGRQRAQEAQSAARAQKLFDSEALTALREKFAFQSRMQRQATQEVRDLARTQMQSARDVARAARESAREQAAALKAQIAQAKALGREMAAAARSAAGGAGRVRHGVGRAALVGGAGGALVGASARRGLDRLTRSGVSIDDSVTAASIHVYGSLATKQARASAESLRKRLMPEAVKLGARTADLLSAYVEASQAGVGDDILDKVVNLGSKYAKMNKLSLPNTLEETGYALQGLKSFGPVDDKTVSQYFNGMSYLVATTAANREQMSAFGKKGLSAGASVGMSMQDALAFGAAATAAGAEGSQASRMLSSQGGRIAGWSMKARDIQHKKTKTEEDRLFLQAPQMMGFGNYQTLAAKFKKDFFGTFADVQEGLKRVVDPLKRRSIEKMLFGQEFGALTDSMIMGGNLRQYRQKLDSPEAKNFLDQNWAKQTGSFGFIVDQIKSVFQNLSDSLGLSLKPIYSDLRDYAIRMPAEFQNFEDTFRVGLRGFMSGLGSPDGSMAGLLRRWLGDPSQFRLNTAWINDFARGFGTGIREVVEQIKRFASVFTGGDNSAESLGRLTGKFLAFSAAMVVVAPAVSILGSLGTAIGGFAAVVAGAASVLRAAGLMGGAGAAGKAAGAAEAGAAAGATGLLGKIMGTLGRLVPAFAMPLSVDPSKADQDRMTGRLGRWAREHEQTRDGVRAWVDPPASRAVRESNDRLRGAVEDNTRVQRQSYEGGDLRGLIHKTGLGGEGLSDVREAIDRMGARVQLAAIGNLNAGAIARAAGGGTVGAALGAPVIPGAGGASLYGNTPGQDFSVPDVGSRYGVGGGSGQPGSNRGGSGGGVTDPRMSGDVRQRAQAAHDFFRSKGLSEEATAGILASMKKESSFTPTARGDGGAAHGLFQHHADRRAAIMRATGINMSTASFGQQLEGAWWEMNHGDAGAQRALRALRTPGISARDAGAAFVKNFERPKNDERAERGALAEGMLRQFGGGAGGGMGAGAYSGPLTTDGPVRANYMHGQFGAPGQNLGSFTTAGGRRVTVNNEAMPAFQGFIRELEEQGYKIKSIGGFADRAIRGGDRKSQHAYGNAIDLNPGNNPLGTTVTDMPGNVRDLAKKYGLIWGMDWKGRKDPMHFEWNGTRPWLENRDVAGKAKELLGGKPGQFSSKGRDGGGEGGDKGYSSTGWHKAEAADLAAQSPAERLAAQAPAGPRGGGGSSGSGQSVHAPINVHGVTNPEAVAQAVHKHINDAMNYRTTDRGFQSV